MKGTEVTVTEAAVLKGTTRSGIQRAIAEGRLPARRHVGLGLTRAVWLIKREDLDQWTPATPQERGRLGGEARKKQAAKARRTREQAREEP